MAWRRARGGPKPSITLALSPDLQKLSNCPLMTAAAVDSAGAKLSTHDHERLHTGSAGAHPSRKFSSRAPRAAEAVDSPAPAVDSRASCPPTPPYLSTHENEHLDTCSAGRPAVLAKVQRGVPGHAEPGGWSLSSELVG